MRILAEFNGYKTAFEAFKASIEENEIDLDIVLVIKFECIDSDNTDIILPIESLDEGNSIIENLVINGFIDLTDSEYCVRNISVIANRLSVDSIDTLGDFDNSFLQPFSDEPFSTNNTDDEDSCNWIY